MKVNLTTKKIDVYKSKHMGTKGYREVVAVPVFESTSGDCFIVVGGEMTQFGIRDHLLNINDLSTVSEYLSHKEFKPFEEMYELEPNTLMDCSLNRRVIKSVSFEKNGLGYITSYEIR